MTKITKTELHRIYLQWKREEIESIYLIEAVAAYLEGKSAS